MASEAETRDEGDPGGADRRKFARINVELVVALSYPTLGDVIECKTLDVSEGGAFLSTRRVRPEGTQVKLALKVAEHELALAGVVVRVVEPGGSAPAGMGILFKDLRPGAKMLLSALLAQNVVTYRSVKTPPRSRSR